jgi:thioredoxin 1
MNSEIFYTLLEEKPISFVYFSHQGCSVCKSLRPKIEEMVKKYENVNFLYIDTGEHPKFCAQNNIFSVPTVEIYTEGKENRRWIRNFSVSEIESYIIRLINLMR